MNTAIDNLTLHALFCLSRETLPIDAGNLGRVTGQSASVVAASLVRLERAGLVDASRARLTMLGLARAVAVGADLGGQGLDLSRAHRAPAAPVAAPVAAGPANPVAGDDGEQAHGPGSMPVVAPSSQAERSSEHPGLH